MKFKGEVKLESGYIGEWLQTHKDGEHIKDFSFTGILVGYELDRIKDGDRVRDIVYFADENGKIWKTAIPKIYGRVKYLIKALGIKYGDIFVIKYLGKEKRKVDGAVRYLNKYDICCYRATENPDYVEKILNKITDIPEAKRRMWQDEYNILTTQAIASDDGPQF